MSAGLFRQFAHAPNEMARGERHLCINPESAGVFFFNPLTASAFYIRFYMFY